MTKRGKYLWMRRVSFVNLRDLVGLIAEYPQGLRVKEMDELVRQRKIIRISDDKMPSRTTLYHHRNVLLHLGVVRRDRRLYSINHENSLVEDLLNAIHAGAPSLLEEERCLFAELVVRNSDCQEHFFSMFTACEIIANLFRFVEQGQKVAWKTLPSQDGRQVLLKNLETEKERILTTKDELEAILYGVRYWARDELLLIDELFLEGLGNVMFPIDASKQVMDTAFIDQLVASLDEKSEWKTFSVRELAFEFCSSWKVPLKRFYKFLRTLKRKHPEHVVFVPTPQRLATLTADSRSQEEYQLRSYLQDERGRYISHVRIHTQLKEDIRWPSSTA